MSDEELRAADEEAQTQLAGEMATAIREQGYTGIVVVVGLEEKSPSNYGVAGVGSGLDVVGDITGAVYMLVNGMKAVKDVAPHRYDEIVAMMRNYLAAGAPDLQGRHWEYSCRKCKQLIVTEQYGLEKHAPTVPLSGAQACGGELVLRRPR